MPITRTQNLFRTRDLLLRPFPQSPSFHDFLRQEISEEMDIVNATNNSGIAWAVSEYTLNFQPNQNTYEINVSDWGKVLYCVKATTNPYIPWLPVSFDDVSEQNYGTVWNWFNNSYAQAFALSETPEKMSFARVGVLNATYTVTINPVPQQSAVYKLFYLPGYVGVDDPLESAIQLPEHAELVRLRAATALLPASQWFENEDQNSNRRKELAQSFAFQLQRKEDLFDKYIRGINKPRMVDLDDWNAYA